MKLLIAGPRMFEHIMASHKEGEQSALVTMVQAQEEK